MPEKGERHKLEAVIRQWNDNRLELFEISQPDENLGFHGVIRFYFEDDITGNTATKCLRICSRSLTGEVIETLAEKFMPNMKMLGTCYSLYEVHNTDERRLHLGERPLVVQLNWNTDNRDGCFVLKAGKEILQKQQRKGEKGGMMQYFKRTLSRKDKQRSRAGTTEEARQGEDGSTENPLNQSRTCNPVTKQKAQKNTANRKQGSRQSVPGTIHAETLRSNTSDKPVLPVRIRFSDSTEESFLSAVINYTNSSTVYFKLSPAYALYVAGRFALQCHHNQGSSGQTHRVTSITNKMVSMTAKVIKKQHTIASALAFWMANCSELLNFLKQDKDLSPLTQQAQVTLSHLVHKAYRGLIHCIHNDLRKHLPTFLMDPEQQGFLPAGIEMVLDTLKNTMSLLRRCGVNPALTIQLFSQLFHFISSWLLNQLLGPGARAQGLCSHYWGAALRHRLSAIQAWAEQQGLELAADCHLGHIVQATMLLTMTKYSMQDVKDIQRCCFKLNSLQLQTLLTSYICAANEPHIPTGLIDTVVSAAQGSADNLVRSEGQDIQLEESLDLHLPFLLPEEGYTCDTLRGIPQGFREFLEPICCKGLCVLISQPNCKGNWAVFFSEMTSSAHTTHLDTCREPEIVTIVLRKPLNSGVGVSIVAARGAGQGNLGIYVKSIIKGGPAEMDGRLNTGDQLISVDGQCLLGLSQERAACIIKQTGSVVTLRVDKFGACYHGLEALIQEAASVTNTGEDDHSHTKQNRPSILDSGVDQSPPERQDHLGSSRKKREPLMQRNRQLYRSSPNMAASDPDKDHSDPAIRGNAMAAISSINLYTDTYQRQYLTVPSPRYQNKTEPESSVTQQLLNMSFSPIDGQSHNNNKTIMRQALSQENLCMDSGSPLLDKTPHGQKHGQNTHPLNNHLFPLHTSTSTHNILSDDSSPNKAQQNGSKCGTSMWRIQHTQNTTPSIQPRRIDIPITRPGYTQKNPSLNNFQKCSSLLAVRCGQSLKQNGQTPRCTNITSSHLQASHISATPCIKTPQTSVALQQNSTKSNQKTATTPKKNIFFQNLQGQSGPTANRQADQQYFTVSREQSKDSLLSSGPWRRDVQEKLEERQRLSAVDLLEREVQGLQAKTKRTPLQMLHLEWQFQKRRQEHQQGGDNEDEDDNAVDMNVILQQIDKRAHKQDKGHLKEPTSEVTEDYMVAPDQTSGGFDHDFLNINQENIKHGPAPGNLTFKE